MKEFNAGKLVNPRSFGDQNYYFLVAGEDLAGQTFSLVTRGKGRQNAATRIPIRLKLKNPDLQALFEGVARLTSGNQPNLKDYITIMKSEGLYSLENFELLYVVMPRYGNLVSGLEADAPGGTAKLGETRLEVADREFDEEADLTTLCVYSPFPSWMQFSSGCYDEVQHIDFAFVVGNPTRLVEGASRWGSVALNEFEGWAHDQNNPDDPTGWVTKDFVPVDGKVVLATMWLIELINGSISIYQA